MRLAMAKCAKHGCTVAEQLLRAVLELVALLTAAFTPDPAQGKMIVYDNLKLLCFVGLMEY